MDRSTKQALLLWIMFAPFIWCTGPILFIFWSFFCYYYAGRKKIENGETREQQFNREPWTKEEDPEIVNMNSDINLSDEEEEYLSSHPWMYKVGENKYEPKWKYVRAYVSHGVGIDMGVKYNKIKRMYANGEIDLEQIAKKGYDKAQKEIQIEINNKKTHEEFKKEGLLVDQQHAYYLECFTTLMPNGDQIEKFILHNYDSLCCDEDEFKKEGYIDENTYRDIEFENCLSLIQIKKIYGDDLSLCPDCFPDGIDPRDEGVE